MDDDIEIVFVPLYRFIFWCLEGWRLTGDLAGTHHGYHSVLMWREAR